MMFRCAGVALIASCVVGAQTPAPPAPAPSALVAALALRNLALARTQARDYAGSVADLTDAIALYPGYQRAYYERAESKAAMFDYAGAMADATEALALAATPGQQSASLEARSNFRAARADYAGAVADLEQALPLAPRPAAVEFFLGRLEARGNDRQQAVAHLDRAIAIQPTYAAAYRLRAELREAAGDAAGAASDRTMARELSGAAAQATAEAAGSETTAGGRPASLPPVVQAFALLASGEANVRAHRDADAIADLSQAIALRPGYGDAYQWRASAKSALGDQAAAIADATQALALANTPSRQSAVLRLRSAEEAAAGQLDLAIADLKRLAPVDASTDTLDLALAQREQAKGDLRQAMMAVGQAIAINPLASNAYALRAGLRYALCDDLAQYDLLQARALQAATPPPGPRGAGPVEVLQSLTVRLAAANAFGPALVLARQLTKIQPETQVGWGLLGLSAAAELDDPDAPNPHPTEQEAQAALDAARAHGEAVLPLLAYRNAFTAGKAQAAPWQKALMEGEADFADGDADAAAKLQKQVLALDPRNPLAMVFAGCMSAQARDDDQAIAWFTKALALDPENEAAYRHWGDLLMMQGATGAAEQKYIAAIVANPFVVAPPTGGLRLWTELTHHQFGLARLRPEAAVNPSGGPPIVLQGATDVSTGGTAWVAYASVRQAWRQKIFQQTFPNAPAYRHSLREEHDALKALLKELQRQQSRITRLEPQLSLLQSVDSDGLLDAYILFQDGDQGINQDYAAYRREHETQLRKFVAMYVVH